MPSPLPVHKECTAREVAFLLNTQRSAELSPVPDGIEADA